MEIINAVRKFFSNRGYLEVETPLLAGGTIPESTIDIYATEHQLPWGKSRPLYLLPSPELWMKQLLAEGWGNIFQICKSFRNGESRGRLHNPEFTMLEYYTVDANAVDSLRITEDFFLRLSQRFSSLAGGAQFADNRKYPLSQLFRDIAGIDLARSCQNLSFFRRQAREKGISSAENDTWEELFHRIMVDKIEPALPRNEGAFLLHYPSRVACLAREIKGTPWRDRWEYYHDGVELANCFGEEQDPEKVTDFFRAERKKQQGKPVTPPPQQQFLTAHRKGLPRCSGVALGIDRLVMLLTGSANIGEVTLFSQARNNP